LSADDIWVLSRADKAVAYKCEQFLFYSQTENARNATCRRGGSRPIGGPEKCIPIPGFHIPLQEIKSLPCAGNRERNCLRFHSRQLTFIH